MQFNVGTIIELAHVSFSGYHKLEQLIINILDVIFSNVLDIHSTLNWNFYHLII